jgi:hypothetical protein
MSWKSNTHANSATIGSKTRTRQNGIATLFTFDVIPGRAQPYRDIRRPFIHLRHPVLRQTLGLPMTHVATVGMSFQISPNLIGILGSTTSPAFINLVNVIMRKKFYRADHFRQHLKHSHAGTSGKWTNILENACMKEEPPVESRLGSIGEQGGRRTGSMSSIGAGSTTTTIDEALDES